MLVDIMKHVAKAYASDDRSEEEILMRIKEIFDAEWEDSTDEPKEI